MGAMHLQFYSLSNHILWHIANGVAGSIYLVVSILLLPHIGVAAFPAGIVAGYAGFYTWFAMRLVCRHYQLNAWGYEKTSSLVPLLSLLIISMTQIWKLT